MSSDYGPAQWIPSPFYWPGRAGHAVRWIILHGTAGGSSAQGVAAWFQDPRAQASTHYIIGPDGTVVQCVAEADSAWGNGIVQDGPGCNPAYAAGIPEGNRGHGRWWDGGPNPNYGTISIEHVKGHVDNRDELTAAQQAASFALIAHLCARWQIPRRWADAAGGITGHFSIESVDRASCPGPYPWEALFAYLGGASMSQPTYDELKTQAVQAERERDQAIAERDALRQQLAALQAEYQTVRSQAIAAEQERNQAIAERDALRQQLADLGQDPAAQAAKQALQALQAALQALG
jgi:N-acetyl-anhydromuramyl-L-alanine amidase AmpD